MEQNSRTPQSIIELFKTFCLLEWYGYSPCFDQVFKYSDQVKVVPKIIWRFQIDQGNEEKVHTIEQAIVAAVSAFRGNVEWEITPPNPNGKGRNWVITTKRFHEFMKAGEYSIDSIARSDVARIDPAHGQMANEDIGALLDHLEEGIKRVLLD
jgi:hypothetical protein